MIAYLIIAIVTAIVGLNVVAIKAHKEDLELRVVYSFLALISATLWPVTASIVVAHVFTLPVRGWIKKRERDALARAERDRILSTDVNALADEVRRVRR